MKTKKINIKDTEKIQKVIELVEEKTKARELGGIERLNEAVRCAEHKLKELGIAKKYWKDSFIEIEPESVPNSYKYTAEGTHARIKRYASGWFVELIRRDWCSKEPYGGPRFENLVLSEETQKHLAVVYSL